MSSSAEALYTHTQKKKKSQLKFLILVKDAPACRMLSARLLFSTSPLQLGHTAAAWLFFFFIAETRMDVLEHKQNQPTVLWVACQKAAAAAVDADKDKSAAQRHKHSALPPALQLPFARLMHTFPLLSKSLRNNTGLLFSTSVCLKCLRFNHCQPTWTAGSVVTIVAQRRHLVVEAA